MKNLTQKVGQARWRSPSQERPANLTGVCLDPKVVRGWNGLLKLT